MSYSLKQAQKDRLRILFETDADHRVSRHGGHGEPECEKCGQVAPAAAAEPGSGWWIETRENGTAWIECPECQR